jgi:hypothetical protein
LKGTNAAIFSQGRGGKIVVEAGAQIDTTGKLSSNGDGGYVALLGDGGVSNAGAITTKNGQIILASGSTVTLITPESGAAGVKTALQVVSDGGGVVSNAANGLLISNDGAVTLAGGAINQFGAIEATTSAARTGSILLSTAFSNSGDIVLGPDSLTAILPDESSGTLPTSTVNSTTNDASYFETVLRPQITIQAAGNVDVQGKGDGLGGAFIKAPSAALTIDAGAGQGSTAGTAGTVLLESGSTVDLSGLAGVTLPMSVNQVDILVTAAEVADSPLAAALIGKTVRIDARLRGTRADGLQWVGSPLLDADGYVGLIPQGIDQILTAGGTFTSSAKNVVQLPGSAINVSAGYVQYTGGVIHTTRLLGSDGRYYDIGSANPNLSYTVAQGFTVNHQHWGVTEIFAGLKDGGAHYEPGYVARQCRRDHCDGHCADPRRRPGHERHRRQPPACAGRIVESGAFRPNAQRRVAEYQFRRQPLQRVARLARKCRRGSLWSCRLQLRQRRQLVAGSRKRRVLHFHRCAFRPVIGRGLDQGRASSQHADRRGAFGSSGRQHHARRCCHH